MYGRDGFGITTMIVGFVMWLPIIAALFFFQYNLLLDADKIEIDITKPYYEDFLGCQHDQEVLMGDFMELKETKQVVCEYKEPSFNFWLLIFGFVIGVIATIYIITMSSPWVKNRLDKKKKEQR